LLSRHYEIVNDIDVRVIFARDLCFAWKVICARVLGYAQTHEQKRAKSQTPGTKSQGRVQREQIQKATNHSPLDFEMVAEQ